MTMEARFLAFFFLSLDFYYIFYDYEEFFVSNVFQVHAFQIEGIILKPTPHEKCKYFNVDARSRFTVYKITNMMHIYSFIMVMDDPVFFWGAGV